MCETPPNSLHVNDSVNINETDSAKSLEEQTALALQIYSNESNSMDIVSSNSFPVTPTDRTTRNSAKVTPALSRFTRSRDNPDFVAKQKNFMAQVQAANLGIEAPKNRQEVPIKRKWENVNSPQPRAKKKKLFKPDSSNNGDWQNDSCCWECHREGQFICCEMCPRVFHLKCVGMEKEPEDEWACQECHSIMLAENVDNRTRAMQLISVDQLCVLLKFALSRLKASPALSPFYNPVDIAEFPTYRDVIIHPLDLQTLEKNIKKKLYGSTVAFLADARWIYHNSVIFNGANSKVTSLAKNLMKILRQELSEIETCPDCYQNAHLKPDSWFTEACRLAHPLVWAKLKGFPYWPAKAVKWKEGNVDVRFFGRHDRSWVQLKDCCLFSEQMPTTLKSRNRTLETCLIEVKKHIEKLKERFGEFKYAPQRVVYNPHDTEQIKLLLPLYKGPTILKIKPNPRTASRQSQSGTDDETSSVASSDSYSVYSRKLGFIEASSVLSAGQNPDDNESKIDEATEEIDSDKCDIDPNSNFKISDVHHEKSDREETGDVESVVKATKDDTCHDEDSDKVESEDLSKNECEDGLHCDKETDEGNTDKLDIESNQSNVDEDMPNPNTEVNNVKCEKPMDNIDNSCGENTHSVGILDEDSNKEVLFMQSPKSITEDVDEDSKLLAAELGINITLEVSSSQVSEKQNKSLVDERDTLPVGNKPKADVQLNESVFKLECINALLSSPDNDLQHKAAVNEEVSEDMETNVEDLLEMSAKSNSLRSSLDEDSFSGFFSEEESTKKKAESCKNVLKKFRLQALLRKDDDSESETQSDVSKVSNNSPQISSAVEKPESSVPSVTHEESNTNQSELDPVDDSIIPSVSESKSVEAIGDGNGSDSVIEEEEEDPLLICQSPFDIKSYASKMFHNVTISSNSGESSKESKNIRRGKSNSSVDSENDSNSKSAENAIQSANSPDRLLAAVKLVQNIGNIAIKRVDSKTMEHTSGNDKVTISVAANNTTSHPSKHEKPGPKSVKEARKAYKSSSQVQHQLAAMGSSVSLAKAVDPKKDEKAKMLSGVDTTRLSPSISIIPVATTGSSDKQKVRCISTVSIPPASSCVVTPTVTTTSTLKSGSPLVSSSGRTTPCSNNSSSPNVPPPLLSHAMGSVGNIRGMFGAHLPHLQGFQNNPRATMPSPNMRMLSPNPAMMLANRLSAGVLRPSPPEAGPLSTELGKHSMKLAEMMRSSLEEVIGGLVGMGSPEARLAALQLELERCNWRHQQEMADVRHNADVMLVEMRASMEAEKQRSVEEARKHVEQKISDVRRTVELQANDRIVDIKKQCELEKKREVEETKKKQWCANCQKEALLFCCWNTSYCDYPCQQNHWPQHMSVCGQNAEHGAGAPGGSANCEIDNANGDMSAHSSGVSTPIHSNMVSHLLEDDGLLSSEENKRKKRKEGNVHSMLNILHKDEIMPSRRKPNPKLLKRILPQPQPPLQATSAAMPMTIIPVNSDIFRKSGQSENPYFY